MVRRHERRSNPRLRLRYPIRVQVCDGESVLSRTITTNLSARGAYFSTFRAEGLAKDGVVSVVLSVPHRFGDGQREVMLDLRGVGRIVRIDGPQEHGAYGEDGAVLVGVAIEFSEPLTFRYRWVA